MATIKLYLKQRALADGTYPLVLKILKDNRPSQTHLNVSLRKEDWDAKKRLVKKSHPNSVRLNNFLLKKLADANNKAIEAQTVNEDISSKSILRKIKPNSGAYFFKHATVYLQTLKEAGKFNEYTADKPRINHFKEFLKGQDIAFPDITVGLLERFQHYLRANLKVGKKEPRPVSERTVVNHLVVIRSVFSQAIKQGAVEKKYYPFGKEGISIKFPDTQKVGLSFADVVKIENLVITNQNHNHARNLWLISFYFGGMRVSDVLRLKWSDFQNNRLHYTMGKNRKPGSLKADEKVFVILSQYEKYKRFEDDFVFPELKRLDNMNDTFLVKRIISDQASRNDKFLRKFIAPQAGINNKLTMHIARHTFANIAAEANISLLMVQKIFRHSKMSITMAYMGNFIHKDTDEALDAVLNIKPANDNQNPNKPATIADN